MTMSPQHAALFAVAQDAGPFVKGGTQFSIGKHTWIGTSVVSPVAVYLLKKVRQQTHGGGGLVGAMISAALDRGDDGLSTCKAEDLPGPARAALDPRQKLGAADVVVIPRATVGLVKSASFNNVITVRAGAETFKLNTGLFRLWKTPRQFAELGWVLNQEVVPTAAPVHDMRAPGAPPPKPPLHPAVRVLLIVLSFAALAGVVALKMWAR